MSEQAAGPKYPNILLHMVGENGNAFAILARANRAMREARLTAEEKAAFNVEATSGDYDHLVQTCIRWFDTD
jgi:hypothetical protein